MNQITPQSAAGSTAALFLIALTYGQVAGQELSIWQTPQPQTGLFDSWCKDSNEQTEIEMIIRGQDSGAQGGGGGNLAGDATNPTSNLAQYQVQNTFIPSTYEASGFAHTLSLQMVKPFWQFNTESGKLWVLHRNGVSS